MAFVIVKLLNPITLNLTSNILPHGEYDNLATYYLGDSVSYLGSSYIATQSTTGNLPTDTEFWQVWAEKGDDSIVPGPAGDDGTDAVNIELQKSATHIQWRLVGGEWANLVALTDLVGATGDDGTDAVNIELQKSATHIQWRLVGGEWANLVILTDLKGDQGDPGADAINIELQKSATHIQWRLVGGEWANLVALTDITGPSGSNGADGSDGAAGADGSDGAAGADGTDAVNIELQKSATHIQWRLVGGEWANLVALTDLVGAAGADGSDGAAGADGTDAVNIELQKSATHIQWRLVGGEWANLVALTDITGPSVDIDDTPVDGETAKPISSNWAFDHAASGSAHGVSGKMPYHGIQTIGALSFDNTEHILTVATGITYWVAGVPKVISGSITCDIDTDNTLTDRTLYWFYFDDTSGTLKCSTSINLLTQVPIATVYWNGAAGATQREYHAYNRNVLQHILDHMTVGCRYKNDGGFGQTAPTTSADGTLQIEIGTLYDEDLAYTTGQLTTMRCWHKYNSTSYTFTDYSLPYPGGGAGDPYWLDTDDYTLKSVADNRFVCYWVYGSLDNDRPLYIIPTHNANAHGTMSAARAEAVPNLVSLGINPEIKLLYRWIYQGDGAYQEGTDYRISSPAPNGAVQSLAASSITSLAHGATTSTNVQGAIEELTDEKLALTGGTMSGDLNMAGYKAIALVCDNGATLPSTPVIGQWFLHTPVGRKVLMMYTGTAWQPIMSIGTMTLYVAGNSVGTDSSSNGTGTLMTSGSLVSGRSYHIVTLVAGDDFANVGGYNLTGNQFKATGTTPTDWSHGSTLVDMDSTSFLTIQYAINQIPGLYTGNVEIRCSGDTFTEAVTVRSKYATGVFTIYIYGTLEVKEIISSAAITWGSGKTRSVINKSGVFNGDAYSNMLAYYATDATYRVIDGHTVTLPADQASVASTDDIAVGDIIKGATSGAYGDVIGVTTTSGTFAGSNWVGTFLIQVTYGTFQSGENLDNITDTKSAVCTTTSTVTVNDDNITTVGAPSATTQNVVIFNWLTTVVGSLTATAGQKQFYIYNTYYSRGITSSGTSAIQMYYCKCSTTTTVMTSGSGSAININQSLIDESSCTVGIVINSSSLINCQDVKIICNSTISNINGIYSNAGSGCQSFYGIIIDGINKYTGGNGITLGTNGYITGSTSTSWGYLRIRNLVTGETITSGGQMTGNSTTIFSNCDTNKSVDAASFGYES